MFDAKFIDDLAHRLSDAMPPGIRNVQSDLEKNLRATVQAALSKLDLVTREEFDVQTKVLARTRTKLEALESVVAELESRLLQEREK